MKSSGNIFLPLAVGTEKVETVTRYMWPTYRRYTLATGGDAQATFTIQAEQAILERWFDLFLGYHFEETWGSQTAFMGYVHSMTYAANGVTLRASLKDVYNKIAVKYKTSSAGSDTVTAFASDTASIAKYGTRTLLYDLGQTYVNSTTATAVRDDLLDALAWPKVQPETVNLSESDGTPRLQVTIMGYAESLDGVLLKDASTSNSTASAEVTAALSGAEFVSAGDIDTNSTVVTEEVDYVGAWQRIKAMTDLRGSGTWLAGCYQGRKLDYFQANLSTIKYYVDVRTRQKGRVIYEANQDPAALPLVKPGAMAFVRDLMAARNVESVLANDPRALFVERVEYSAAGLVLKGTDSTGLAQAVALQMALQ